MKLKEINRTAIQSWSPAQHYPTYLATGTSAQQLDASFSTNASLEIFELDLAEPSLTMRSCGTFSSPHRYHKLVWGPHGMDSQGHPSGVLIAGGDNGDVIVYDPAKIIAGDRNVIIASSDKHTGPVRALDINSFQTNLVASGGNESEIYIWDLNTFGSPMTPGPKPQPLEDISSVAWNRQVQHILASVSPSGRVSVWDLRKNDLIIKVSEHSNKMHCSGLAWNPEVATQLVLASEDDRMPVIQMWDLRFATSPLKILENHTRGVLAIAWSLADPELLLSCAKDNRILCWNPNTAEVLYELPTSTQWCFDIQWCPRNPAVLSAASFDGHIGIYSIMGGGSKAQEQRQADQISTSFGNMDPFGTGQTLPPLQLTQSTTSTDNVTPLKKPPRWIRKPVGASFAFGGKLVSLENTNLQQPSSHRVHISQVVTETVFLDRSKQLQAMLSTGKFAEFCQTKIDATKNEFEKTVWSFLKISFEDDARGKYLELLGYKKEEIASKIAAALEGGDAALQEQLCMDSDPVPAPSTAPKPGDQLDPLVPTSLNQLIPEPSFKPVPQIETQFEPIPMSKSLFESIPQSETKVDHQPSSDLIPPVVLIDESEPPKLQSSMIAPVQAVNVSLQPQHKFDQISLQPGLDESISLQPVSDESISLQPVADDSIGLQPESDEPISLQPRSDEPISKQLGSDELISLQPVSDDSISLQPGSDESLNLQIGSDELLNLQSGSDEPNSPQPEADEPISKQLGSDELISLQPVSDEPISLQPGSDEPISLQPVADESLDLQIGSDELLNLQSGSNEPNSPQLGSDETINLQPGSNEEINLLPGSDEPISPQLGSDEPISLQPGSDGENNYQLGFDQLSLQPGSEFDQLSLQPASEFDQLSLQPASEFDQLNLQPGSEFDQLNLQPGSEFDQLNLQPGSEFDQMSQQLGSEFNKINLEPGSEFDQISLPLCSENNQIFNSNDPQLASELNPLVVTPAGRLLTPGPDFDPTSLSLQSELDLNLPAFGNNLPVEEQCFLSHANLPSEADFKIIAATNLEQAVKLESPSAPLKEPASVLALDTTATTEEEAMDTDFQPENTTDKALSDEVPQPTAYSTVHSQRVYALMGLSVTAEMRGPVDSPKAVCGVTTALSSSGVHISACKDLDGLITQALLTGDFDGAVELCLNDNRMADSIILAMAGGPALLTRTQKKYFAKKHSKITKLISAVVLKDLRDILQTCDLLNWKEALAAVMTYAQPQEFSSLCDLLGSHLETSKEGQLQMQACLCYICAGNVEKLVACWTEAKGGTNPLSLLELVEKVVVLRQAVKQTQESGPTVVGVLLAEKMSQYSSLLASQGSLATAMAYLPENATQKAVQQLYDRLTRALGKQPTAPIEQRPSAHVSGVQPLPANNPGTTAMEPQSTPVPVEVAVPPCAPTQSQYYQPMRPASTVTSWSNQTPTALLSLPPQASDQQAELTSSKYGIQDPASTITPPAFTTHPCMYNQQYQPHPQVNQYTADPSLAAVYQPPQHSAAYTHPSLPPSSHYLASAPSPGLKPQYIQPSMGLSAPSSHPSFLQTVSSSFSPTPVPSGESFQHGGQWSPASYMPPPPPTGTSGPQNGWNDPPTLSGMPKKKKALNNYTPPAPITAPIMVPLGVDPQGHAMSFMPPQPIVQSQAPGQLSFSGNQQPLSTPPMNPVMPKTSGEGAPGAPIGDAIQPMQSITAEKILKKPIPDEHLILKTTFEVLIQKCLAAANDPQTKRKLDDANKRLETLYDKLREQTLSPAIVRGLHNMVRCIESRSYLESINIHTHIVSNNNFSETSAFMPVLKVVLTQANRLAV